MLVSAFPLMEGVRGRLQKGAGGMFLKKNLLITKIIRTFTAKITRSISFKKKIIII